MLIAGGASSEEEEGWEEDEDDGTIVDTWPDPVPGDGEYDDGDDPEDVWPDDDGEDVDTGEVGDAANELELIKPAIEAILSQVGLDNFTQAKIDARDATSGFNIDEVEQRSVDGTTFWIDNGVSNTFWLDVDNDGQPETHVKVLSDGSALMDDNFDGSFTVKLN
ncbi:hypothetical protein AS593_13180 [Caulobacter vibrioides]|nr:hypothetical protein AS593_13180 [Caulobacter vibrioides]